MEATQRAQRSVSNFLLTLWINLKVLKHFGFNDGLTSLFSRGEVLTLCYCHDLSYWPSLYYYRGMVLSSLVDVHTLLL